MERSLNVSKGQQKLIELDLREDEMTDQTYVDVACILQLLPVRVLLILKG